MKTYKLTFGIITTLILVGIPCLLQAQYTISGKVQSTAGVDIAYANVWLLTSSDSSLVSGTTTSPNGQFDLLDIPKGNYYLSIGYLGYQTQHRQQQLNQSINLGTILLLPSTAVLEAAVVTAKRKLIRRKIDRLVFDVENSLVSTQGDAMEVLSVTPGLSVQNNNIRMIGKSSVAVMIDEKIIQLPGDELASFLRSIPSEDIKSIEVITTPPAQYDAAGNSGLINIQLKKARQDSWNALLRAGYLQRHSGAGSAGANFNFNKDKWTIASSIFGRDGHYYQEQDDYAYFPDGLWYTSSPFKARIGGHSARVDLSYQANPNWNVGGQYIYSKTNYRVSDAPYTPVFDYDTDEILRFLQSEGYTELIPSLQAINFNNQITLDTLGKQLSIKLDYFTFQNPDTKSYTGISVINDPFSQQYYAGINANQQAVDNLSFTADLNYPTSWANLSLGVKMSRSISHNDISFFNSGLVDQVEIDMLLAQNDFRYQEAIQAGYVSLNKQFNDNWEAQFGLRMEATQTTASSENLDFTTQNDYLRFFPTVYLSHTLSEHSKLVLSYNKRISRPQFFNLNPNIYFVNPFQSIDGNPFLQPAFTDNVELAHHYKNWSGKVYYSYENNAFGQVPLPDSGTNLIRFTYKNYINTNRYGATADVAYDQLDWWTSNNSLAINYARSTFRLSESQMPLSGLNATLSTTNNFVLNGKKTCFVSLNYWYQFPGFDGILETKSMGNLSATVQFLFFDKKWSLQIRANDILKTQADRNTSIINGVLQEARYYYDSRSLSFTLTYKLGNTNISAKRHQSGNQEERSRTGN